MVSSDTRTYHDPLHGGITLRRDDPSEAVLIQLIDTPEFQRLRRIRQLGPASLALGHPAGSTTLPGDVRSPTNDFTHQPTL